MRFSNTLALMPPLAVLLLWQAAAQSAEVYRWVDKSGEVHYGDKPPTPNAKPHVLPPIQTIGVIGGKEGGATAETTKPESPGLRISITSPVADEVLRGDDRRLPVSLSLGQPLAEGLGLLYLLDGSARNSAPTRSLSYTLENVERGTHLVSATVVDGSGRELGRSAPVIVHMKPPTVNLAPKIPRPPATGSGAN